MPGSRHPRLVLPLSMPALAAPCPLGRLPLNWVPSLPLMVRRPRSGRLEPWGTVEFRGCAGPASAAARRAAAGVALQTRPVADEGEVAAFAAGVALVALHQGLGPLGAGGGCRGSLLATGGGGAKARLARPVSSSARSTCPATSAFSAVAPRVAKPLEGVPRSSPRASVAAAPPSGSSRRAAGPIRGSARRSGGAPTGRS